MLIYLQQISMLRKAQHSNAVSASVRQLIKDGRKPVRQKNTLCEQKPTSIPMYFE